MGVECPGHHRMTHTTPPLPSTDWAHGGDRLLYQHCSACAQRWYFERPFCPGCGHPAPITAEATGLGTVSASTLVLRAPSDEFRALAPYRIVLVELAEGVRVMGHGEPALVIGDAVRCEVRHIANLQLPYFVSTSPR